MAMIIRFKSGLQSGSEKTFDLDGISFGRDPACDVVLDDIEVSRHHARIYKSDTDFFLEDLNSTNGTFLNGRSVKKHEIIRNGDLITFGESVILEFYTDEPVVKEFSSLFENDEAVSPVRDAIVPPVVYQEESAQAAVSPKITAAVEEKWLSRLPSWLIILVIALTFLVFFCFIPFIIIEVSDQWCNLFSGFFNALSPGACP
jgi:pSer/pThr/pTyr-binding forkhead associated (FHA) protein